MAYGNWGGKVWRDGIALYGHCDNTIERLSKGERYTHYLGHWLSGDSKKHAREDGKAGLFYWPCHAIVGDMEAGVLVCLYKSYPIGIFAVDETLQEVKEAPCKLPEVAIWKTQEANYFYYNLDELFYDENDDWKETALLVDVKGTQVKLWKELNMVFCRFTDKLGRRWKGASGYEFGEKFEDWE